MGSRLRVCCLALRWARACALAALPSFLYSIRGRGEVLTKDSKIVIVGTACVGRSQCMQMAQGLRVISKSDIIGEIDLVSSSELSNAMY